MNKFDDQKPSAYLNLNLFKLVQTGRRFLIIKIDHMCHLASDDDDKNQAYFEMVH